MALGQGEQGYESTLHEPLGQHAQHCFLDNRAWRRRRLPWGWVLLPQWGGERPTGVGGLAEGGEGGVLACWRMRPSLVAFS